jgi:glycosyltransferase involved in cell wall biosynthesis
MEPAPRFSVVIAAFNAERTIESAVSSVLSQTDPDHEVIVVDDGSSDRTRQVLQEIKDPRVRVAQQRNRGAASARNAGIGLARGDYVSFLDSDDLLLPHYLERAGEALERTPGVGLAYTDAYPFDPVTGRVLQFTTMHYQRPPIPPPADSAGFLMELLDRNFIYNAVTVPRPVLEEVGGFDESVLLSEDWDLWLRIIIHGYRAALIPGQQALYRMHPGQKSNDAVAVFGAVAEIFRRIRISDMPTEAHRRRLEERQLEAERAFRVLAGEAGLASRARSLRSVLGRVRRRAGLTQSWYKVPPPEVAEAYPDLTKV